MHRVKLPAHLRRVAHGGQCSLIRLLPRVTTGDQVIAAVLDMGDKLFKHRLAVRLEADAAGHFIQPLSSAPCHRFTPYTSLIYV